MRSKLARKQLKMAKEADKRNDSKEFVSHAYNAMMIGLAERDEKAVQNADRMLALSHDY